MTNNNEEYEKITEDQNFVNSKYACEIKNTKKLHSVN